MKIIAFITEGIAIWEMQDSGSDTRDPQAQPAPGYEFDQCIAW